MKFTVNWLKQHLETDASLEQISTTLTAIGLEVEEIIDQAAALLPFTVAKIEQAEQHPNADRLRVCQVNTGSETLQIVCGAPNARAGINVALASIGSTIPTNGMKIKPSSLRDVASNGMLCSSRELGLGDEHDGIMELADDAILGESIVSALGLDDPVIDIAITPNRADCTSVRGIARDLAAAGLGTLKPLAAPQWQASGSSDITVTLDDAGCHQFVGCHLRNVRNQESPAWLQQRLQAIGLRPISALVDITNYITFDLGRPLHVYDISKLKGNITVRESRTDESLDALNDKSYTLAHGAIAITDDSGVIGLGGIIGGTSTGCDIDTSELFLEVASFDPIRIATTGRELQIDSDARFRFERGIDPAFLEDGARIAVQMILDLCGGQASELTSVGATPDTSRYITLDPDYITRISGLTIEAKEQARILTSLGFSVDGTRISPPTWRADIEGKADLAEEILRIYGYDSLPISLLPKLPTITGSVLTPMQQRTSTIRHTLAARGLFECKTWSFLASSAATLFGGQEEALELMNPISSELDTMRPNLLPNLLSAAAKNRDRGTTEQQLFEIGLEFHSLHSDGQKLVAAAIQTGTTAPRNHYAPTRPTDCYDAKATACAIIDASGFDAQQLQIKAEAPAWYHPGRSGTFTLGKQIVGHFGELHPAVLKAMGAPARTVATEVFIESIPLAKKKSATRPALNASAYQATQRDFAFTLERSLAANDLVRAIKGSDKKLIQQVQLFDAYEGEHVEEGKKSLAFTLSLQAPDRTLTDDEIEAVSQKVIASAEKIGALLRA